MLERPVFISHASEDKASAQLLCARLERAGVLCWIAPRDVPAGRRWAEAITEAIDACTVFVLVFSAVTHDSPNVRTELEMGASSNKAVLLVNTDGTDPKADREIGYFVNRVHWYDASDGGVAAHADRIVAAVTAALPSGPPAAVLSEGERPKRAIGIDVSETQLRACIVDLEDPAEEYAALVQWVEPLPASADARTALKSTGSLLRRVIEEHFKSTEPVGVGIALPGQVDAKAGTLKFGAHLFGAKNVPFKTRLSRDFPGLRVRVDNEVRCLTRCELHAGTGRDYDDFVCLLVATGVGSGTVIDRKIYFGQNYCAGEIGHVKIATTGGLCACGQVGCLETFVNADAITTRTLAKLEELRALGVESLIAEGEAITIPRIVEALEEWDEPTKQAIDEIAGDLGRGIANYLNLVNPSVVTIGGWVMDCLFEHMSDEVSNSLKRNALAEVATTPIIHAGFTDEGISRGAALIFHPRDAWPFSSVRLAG